MSQDSRTRVFFEIHSGLPREGPGNAESTRRAFSLLEGLPPHPNILDIGCGPGKQTLDLIDLTEGEIVAVDNHQPFLDRLSEAAARKGVADRVRTVNADMCALGFREASFDLIWAEGSAYILGFENALRTWKPFLKDAGYLAATEVTWTTPNPPPAVQRFWVEAYPAIQDVQANLATIRRAGYRSIGHFVLPESAWWDDYYTPIEDKLHALQNEYQGSPEAIAVLDDEAREIALYRRYSACYGYVFYVMRAE